MTALEKAVRDWTKAKLRMDAVTLTGRQVSPHESEALVNDLVQAQIKLLRHGMKLLRASRACTEVA